MPANRRRLTMPASSTTPADSAAAAVAAAAASHLDASSPEPGQKRRRSARVQDQEVRHQLQQAAQQSRAGAPPSKGVTLSSLPAPAPVPAPFPRAISTSGLPGQKPMLMRKTKKLRTTTMQTKQAAEPISAASTDDFGCGNTGATEHPDVHVHVHAQPTISSSGDKASPSDLVLPPSEFTPSYWLLKAEPESRIEKGKDVKFSIDDLAACKEPAGWDGVRNYAARNNLRAMKKGDLAFFYHSNCKQPGIVGIMEISETASVDETAFDPEEPYYDPRSDRSNPKWFLVKVKFVRKFSRLVGLQELKSYGTSSGGRLANMTLLKMSRLSVSPVAKAEWEFILSLEGKQQQ